MRSPLPGRLQLPARNGVRPPYLGSRSLDRTSSYSNRYPHGSPYHDHDHDGGHRHVYVSSYRYSYAYGYPGWYGYPYYGYPFVINAGFYDWSVPDDSGVGQSAYTGPPYADNSGYADSDPYSQSNINAQQGTQDYYRPSETARQPYAAAQVSPVPEAPLTLIFKDGRTPEEIQNYIVSSTSLTDLDRGHYRQIPLAEIDIVATAKINRVNGVFFRVPGES